MAFTGSPSFLGIDPPVELTGTAACHTHTTTGNFDPPRRPDTPQLTMHDYRKLQRLQRSPLLSTSPGPDRRRVRRKQSFTDLAANSAAPALPWLASAASSPSSPSHELLLAFSSHPPTPTTPQQRQPTTSSPSLSSTVTTLQSTPAHTPVLRGGVGFQPPRSDPRAEFIEPLRTKRKFTPFKQAKRLPRRAGSGGERGEQLVWEVYAAIFDPVVDQGASRVTAFDEVRYQVQRQQQQQQQDQAALPYRADDFKKEVKSVRFAGLCHTEGAAVNNSLTELERSAEEKDPTATSTFSLSRFEFPVPPGQDNWAGTFGQLASENSATLHYYDASFDIVNPHASLLLGAHDIETPAEIDGLLDDYFDNSDRDSTMTSRKLTGNASQNSLVSSNESSHRPRVLYDDPDSARRMILRKQDAVLTPSKAVIQDSPLAYKSMAAPKTYDHGHPTLSSTNRGSIKTDVDPLHTTTDHLLVSSQDANGKDGQDGDIIKYGGKDGLVQGDRGRANKELSVSGSEAARSRSRGGRSSCKSDPFDLHISDSQSNSRNKNDVAEHETSEDELRHIMRIRAVPPIKPQDSGLKNGGADPHANATDQESEPTIKDIVRQYDHARVPSVENNTASGSLSVSSASIEKGRAVTIGEGETPTASSYHQTSQDSQNPFLSMEEKRQRERADEVAWMSPYLLTPPTPAAHHQRQRYSNDYSELPTSERTYGETNQLLRITPEVNHTPDPPTSYYQAIGVIDCQGRYTAPISEGFYFPYPPPRAIEDPYRYPTGGIEIPPYPGPEYNENRPHDTGFNSSAQGFDFDLQDGDLAGRSRHRGSSIYPADISAAWETATLESQTELQALGRPSLESYADTSAYDGQVDVPPMPRNPRSRWNSVDPARIFGSQPDANREDTDVQKAVSLITDKIMDDNMLSKSNWGGSPNIDRQGRARDLKELERLRRENPSTIRKATELIASMKAKAKAPGDDAPKETGRKLKKKIPERPNYDPRRSFSRIFTGLGSHTAASESQRRLLATPPTATPNNLQFSASDNTFVTVHDHGTPAERYGAAPPMWSPFEKDSTARVLGLDRQLPSLPSSASIAPIRRGGLELTRSNRRSRAAMSSMYAPIELQTVRNTRNTRTRGGLGDAELIAHEPGWRTEPDFGPDGPLNRYLASHGNVNPRMASRDSELGFDEALIMERNRISDQYMLYCAFCPVLSLLFICGGFDWVISRRTSGRIKKMGWKQKRQSLLAWLPLGVFLYTAAGIALAFGLLHLRSTVTPSERSFQSSSTLMGKQVA